MLLLIDNYDSFTHNLARYFEELGQEVQVVRNNEICCSQIAQSAPDYLVFSPGPGTPVQAGITLDAIKQFAGHIPILGVCLGHQAIGQVFGATLQNAKQIRHGKTSQIYHSDSGLFEQVSCPFIATRYHSLVLDDMSMPSCLSVTAWCQDKPEQHHAQPSQAREVMAIQHKALAVFGVQFHPESLLTEFGHHILSRFIQLNLPKDPV
jgi:anthranilate synthase/aminodeoxychorismate synthase-like glutamine amidotransferase